MVLGLAVYVLYRRYQGLPLDRDVKVVLPEPLGVEEVEYQSVLVAFEDDAPFSEETMATAVKLAAKRRRGDPRGLDGDRPDPPAARRAARRAGERGAVEDRAGEADRRRLRVTATSTGSGPNQAGHSIAEEAREMKASAIVIGLRYRNGAPALRQDAADRARRAALPGDRRRRARPRAGDGRADVEVPASRRRAAARATSSPSGSSRSIDHRLRAGDPGRHARPRRRARSRSGSSSGSSSSRSASARLYLSLRG